MRSDAPIKRRGSDGVVGERGDLLQDLGEERALPELLVQFESLGEPLAGMFPIAEPARGLARHECAVRSIGRPELGRERERIFEAGTGEREIPGEELHHGDVDERVGDAPWMPDPSPALQRILCELLAASVSPPIARIPATSATVAAADESSPIWSKRRISSSFSSKATSASPKKRINSLAEERGRAASAGRETIALLQHPVRPPKPFGAMASADPEVPEAVDQSEDVLRNPVLGRPVECRPEVVDLGGNPCAGRQYRHPAGAH